VSDKNVETSVESSVMPGRFGGTLRRGGGNPKRNGGRPPNWLREFCDSLLASAKCKAQVKAILQDSKHPAFAAMWKAVSERAHGKPESPVEHSGEVAIRVIREPRALLGDN
jgi:hypothetical protein